MFLALLTGCGGADGPETGDGADIRQVVTGLPDAARDAKQFQESFAAGATVPGDKERQRYQKLLFDVPSGPSVSGDSATAKVRVRDDDSPQPLGELEWAFAREGGKWKIKSAPLP